MQRLAAYKRLIFNSYIQNTSMFCGQIISSDILPLNLQDTVEEALRIMPVSYTHLTLPTILRV